MARDDAQSFDAPADAICPQLTPRSREVDIAIVGAGLSGSIAAVVLGRAGFRVAIVDRNETHPKEFRVEKIAGAQLELLQRLQLLGCIAEASSQFGEIINARHGRVIDVTRSAHYGIMYHDLVNTIRQQFPPTVMFLTGRVDDVQASAHAPKIVLAGNEVISAKLVILATGMTDTLRSKLGVVRKTVFERHSISFGFNLRPADGRESFDFPALTYYGNQVSDRIDYLNVFPLPDGTMRANLFTFRDHQDEWLRDFRRNPEAVLIQTMPGLANFLGAFRVEGRVQNWMMNLYLLDDYLRDGMVFIGDAFQTSCPAAGTGVSRLLTDVHQLCMVHVPRWFESPGMAADKLAAFYSDPAKQKSDKRSSHLAHYRRALTIDDGWGWHAHRAQAYLRRRVVGWLRDNGILRDRWSVRSDGLTLQRMPATHSKNVGGR